jgi:4-hydroxybutyrate CoA-transferase
MNKLLTSWKEDYARKLTTPDQAVKDIRSGDQIWLHSHAACPEATVEALLRRAESLRDVKIMHIITLGKTDYTKPEYAGSFQATTFFTGANMREAVNSGRAQFVPIFLHEVPSAVEARRIEVCLLTVSPPDSRGLCSLGTSVDCTFAALKHARLVIAQVNSQMPRTLGRSFIHVSKIDHLIEADQPLKEMAPAVPLPEDEVIGRYIADLVEDEATIQLGIGAIPNAVLACLGDKKNLGVHSEMLSDGIVDLIEAGVVTNEAKTLLPGKAVAAFVIGTNKLYRFIDNNPLVEFHPCDFINDPAVIASNHKMTAINSALQIDLTGQVGSDSIGDYIFSGFGGQVDFVRGANRSKGGKAIIAILSTAKSGTLSRIAACLPPGSGVVTSRADVHYVVTEYGVAQLWGKSIKERVRELVNIAHPKFRESLLFEAKKFGWYG